MGKKIIWSIDALNQVEDIHFYILFDSKSLRIADKVAEAIFESVDILETLTEIYELDNQKNANDGSFRAYYVFNYKVSHRIIDEEIQILRVRHTSQNEKKF